MRRRRTIALTFAIAAASLLLFFARADRRPFSGTPAAPGAPAVCTSSWFGNQCSDRDIAAIMAARSDRAYSGRGMEAIVVFTGVYTDSASGRPAIVGRRAESDVVCLTRNAELLRAAAFELNAGDRALLSGTIDRRIGRTLYLTECAYWRHA